MVWWYVAGLCHCISYGFVFVQSITFVNINIVLFTNLQQGEVVRHGQVVWIAATCRLRIPPHLEKETKNSVKTISVKCVFSTGRLNDVYAPVGSCCCHRRCRHHLDFQLTRSYHPALCFSLDLICDCRWNGVWICPANSCPPLYTLLVPSERGVNVSAKHQHRDG